MNIQQNLSINCSTCEENQTVFRLIKHQLDGIKTEEEFVEFKKWTIDGLQGVIEYLEVIEFTDKQELIHRHQSHKE